LDDIKNAVWNFIKSRSFFLAVVFIALFSILIQRVFYLQIVKGGEYQETFTLKTEKQVSLSSTRGNIFDRNGKLLAYSELSYSVTIEDNGTYASIYTRNARLNETIYKLIKLVEKNGDKVADDFGIVLEGGRHRFTQEGTSLLRFKADVYGRSLISQLKIDEELADADTVMEYLCSEKKYWLPDVYTEEKKSFRNFPKILAATGVT
jgi:penicillin-binding protein 2